MSVRYEYCLSCCQCLYKVLPCRYCHPDFDLVSPGSDVWRIRTQLANHRHFITSQNFWGPKFNVPVPCAVEKITKRNENDTSDYEPQILPLPHNIPKSWLSRVCWLPCTALCLCSFFVVVFVFVFSWFSKLVCQALQLLR